MSDMYVDNAYHKNIDSYTEPFRTFSFTTHKVKDFCSIKNWKIVKEISFVISLKHTFLYPGPLKFQFTGCWRCADANGVPPGTTPSYVKLLGFPAEPLCLVYSVPKTEPGT